jgi:hypothetical protein
MKAKKYLIFYIILAVVFTASGQIVPPPSPPPPPPGLPIDSNLVFLLVVGLLYGIKKVRNYSIH